MSREDFYLILQVGRSATVNDIKRAFRKLARRYHPDINPGDRTAEEYFKRISEAYEILSDPLKKQFYDQNGFYTEGVLETKTTAKGAWGFSFQGFDFSNAAASPFGEFFGDVLSRRAARREPERGLDLEYQIPVSFTDSIRGFKTRITVSRKHLCSACHGNGGSPVRDSTCPGCHGSGKVTKTKGHLQFTMSCVECAGSGRLSSECPDCGGDGRKSMTEVVDVDIPAGVSTGSRLRFPGKGDMGRLGGPPGDLFIVTNVTPHSFFNRAGDNIQCTVPITFWEATLGAKIAVPTVDGNAVIRIAPGTQNGQTFRMRGKGAPSLSQPGSRGDQFVEVKVLVPHIGDERSKEILRELARLNPEDPRKDMQKP